MSRTWSGGGLFAAILVCVSVLMAVLWYWLPVRLDSANPYTNVTLAEGIRLRAWAGTIASVWGFSGLPGAARPMLALNLLAWWVWLSCCLWLLGRHVVGSNTYRWFVLMFWAFMLGFTATSFNAYLSFFIDTVASAWIALTVLACVRYLRQPTHSMRILMVVAPILAVLTHESVLVLLVVVVLWCIWKVGIPKTVLWFWPSAIAVVVLLALAPEPEKLAHGLSIGEYFQIGLHQTWAMIGQSANFFGILSGPGVGLWIVFVCLGLGWLTALGEQARWRRAVVFLAMPTISFATLLVAHDTNRLTATLWLPLVLLVNESDEFAQWVGECLLDRKVLMLFLLILQVLNPPSLIYRNGIAPYNCYTWRLIHGLQDAKDALKTTPWQLRIYGENYLTRQAAAQCAR